MELNETGEIAGNYWLQIPEHFPHVVIHEYIVMPNHIHGIIELVGTGHAVSYDPDNGMPVGTRHDVGTRHGVSLPPTNTNDTVGTSHGISDTINDGISNTINDAAIVQTCHGMSQQPPRQSNTTQFGKPVPGSVSVIINQYKSSVKRWCNKNGHTHFQWQSRFHDHIIRDEQSYQRISEYIINNPAKWADDKFYST